MVTLVQEFDTRQFERGVIRVRQGLDQIEAEARAAGIGFDKAFDGSADGLKKSADASRDLGTQTGVAAGALNQLRTLLPAITAGLAANKIVEYANAYNQVERSVQTVVPSLSQVAGVTGELVDIASEAGISLEGTAQTFQQFSIATNELNISQSQTLELVDTLSRGLSLFATSTSAASAAQTQLAQAFASGRLQGDEFRSIAENFPPLIDAIAEVLGVARSEVRDLSSEGVISTQVLFDAFGILRDRIEELGGTVERTSEQGFTAFRNRLTEFIGAVDNATGTSNLFTQAFDNAAENIDNVTNFLFPNLNARIEESAEELDDARQAVVDYGGSVEDLESNTGGAAVATQEYNDKLEEHRELLAEAASAAADVALKTKDTAVSLSQGADSFEKLGTEARLVVNDVEDLPQIMEDLGAGSKEAAEGLADAELSIKGAGDEARVTASSFTALNQVFAEFEQTTEDINRQGQELAETFDFIRRNSAESQRELRAEDQALQAQLELRRSLEEAARAQGEASQRAAEVSRAAFEGLTVTFADLAGVSGRELIDFFENLEQLSGELGDSFEAAFSQLANSLGVTATEIEGIFGLLSRGLDAFGVEFESIIGSDATRVIQEFASLSEAEVGVLRDGFDALVSSFGFGTQEVENFGESSISTLTDVNASVGDLQAALGGANAELAQTSDQAAAAEAAIKALVVAAAPFVAGLTARAVGGGEGSQQGAASGAAAGASIGSLFGPIGAIAGGVIGGVAGGVLGGKEGRRQKRQAEKELRQFGRDLASSLLDGFQTTFADLSTQLTSEELDSFLKGLGETIGSFNKDLEGLAKNLETIKDLDLKDIAINDEASTALFDADNALIALGNSAAVAADAIAEQFQINLTDVLTFFERLPPGTADSFAQIEENAQQIAEALAEQFGIGIDQALKILEQLGIRAEGAFAAIEDPADFLAAKLADSFDVTVEEILAVLDQLPEGALDSFSDLANNADLIARNIAVTLGVSFDEALEIVRRFAEQAGISIGDIGTTAADVGAQIAAGFSGTENDLANIFVQLASIGDEAFENIRTNADGTFRLVDDQAQAALENIVASFGGSEEDIQLILKTLAENADLSFSDILLSGGFAFQNLSNEARENIEQILIDLGFTAGEIGRIFGDLGLRGGEAFSGLEQAAAISLGAILDGFGFGRLEIRALLEAIAADGEISFQDLQGASGDALRQILLDFGATEEQIEAIFRSITGAGAAASQDLQEQFERLTNEVEQDFEGLLGSIDDSLGAIGASAASTASNIQSSFSTATSSAQSDFQSFSSSAGASLSALGGQASSAANSISGSFAAAASRASASFSSITSQARAAAAAANNIRFSGGDALGPARFADGGLIEGPTALGGAAAGQAFQFGGVLPGLTSLFGPVTPTAQTGIAGEAGPEGIFPLAEVGGQLGVRAVLPRGSGGGGTNVIIINGVDRNVTDRLEREVSEVAGSVQFLGRQAANDVLSGIGL